MNSNIKKYSLKHGFQSNNYYSLLFTANITSAVFERGLFMPKSNFVINVANENRIENLSLLPLFRVTKVEEF